MTLVMQVHDGHRWVAQGQPCQGSVVRMPAGRCTVLGRTDGTLTVHDDCVWVWEVPPANVSMKEVEGPMTLISQPPVPVRVAPESIDVTEDRSGS